MKKFIFLLLIIWNLAITSFVIYQNIEIVPENIKMANQLEVLENFPD